MKHMYLAKNAAIPEAHFSTGVVAQCWIPAIRTDVVWASFKYHSQHVTVIYLHWNIQNIINVFNSSTQLENASKTWNPDSHIQTLITPQCVELPVPIAVVAVRLNASTYQCRLLWRQHASMRRPTSAVRGCGGGHNTAVTTRSHDDVVVTFYHV